MYEVLLSRSGASTHLPGVCKPWMPGQEATSKSRKVCNLVLVCKPIPHRHPRVVCPWVCFWVAAQCDKCLCVRFRIMSSSKGSNRRSLPNSQGGAPLHKQAIGLDSLSQRSNQARRISVHYKNMHIAGLRFADSFTPTMRSCISLIKVVAQGSLNQNELNLIFRSCPP